MSYDLFFYKHKSNNLTNENIGQFLSANLVQVNEHGNQWFFENDDTGVYYSFETNEASEDSDDSPGYVDYVNTNISFNLNFIRPSFFGLEAFNFIERLITELDLYVENPQAGSEVPTKPTKHELFEGWNKTNQWASKEHADETTSYYPIEKSNIVWAYNYNRKAIQEEIGDEYFASKIFLVKRVKDNEIVTLSVWTEHIPNVLPDTDYYLLHRKYKKLLRTVKDMVLLTRDDFNKIFGENFQPYQFANSRIIHPEKAGSIGKLFNSVRSELDFKRDLKNVNTDSILNTLK